MENTNSMKWYKFLIYAGLFLSALVNIGTAGGYFTGSLYQEVDAELVYAMYPSLKTLDMVMGCVCIAMAVLCIVVRQMLANYKANGPKALLALLVINIVSGVVYLVACMMILEAQLLDSTMIASIITSIVMIVLNKIYFDKRAELFVN